MLVFGFAFMFSGNGQVEYKIGVMGGKSTFVNMFPSLSKMKYTKFVFLKNKDRALEKLKHHHYDLILDTDTREFWVNSSSKKGYFLQTIVNNINKPLQLRKSLIEGEEIRYVDWVIPGILATNMMFNCLFGVGYSVVHYRKNGVLKRLKATPLTPFEFLAAQVTSRLFIITSITAAVYVGCNFFIDFLMLGSYLSLILIFMLGAVCLISLGLIMAARTKSEEFASGGLNLLIWPMMLLSGAWFSLEGSPQIIQSISYLFPLTHIIDAARGIMNDGASLLEVKFNIIALIFMSGLFLLIGSKFFVWE